MLQGIILKGTAQKSFRNENPSSLEDKAKSHICLLHVLRFIDKISRHDDYFQ
jgi:hypothetical protein